MAPREADHTIVALVRSGKVDVVIGTDSDFIIHSCPIVVTKLTYTQGRPSGVVYTMEAISAFADKLSALSTDAECDALLAKAGVAKSRLNNSRQLFQFLSKAGVARLKDFSIPTDNDYCTIPGVAIGAATILPLLLSGSMVAGTWTVDPPLSIALSAMPRLHYGSCTVS